MLKKVLIIAPLTVLFIFLGRQYSLESTRKHEEFLLTQSLFPEITEFVQKNQIPLKPNKIELKKKSFIIYIEAQNSIETTQLQEFVDQWLKSNLKFHEYEFRIEIQPTLETPQ